MKKIIALLFALIFTSNVHAQSLGCFVPFESGQCEYFPYARCVQDVNTTLQAFGSSIASICIEVFSAREFIQRCDAEVAALRGAVSTTNTQAAKNASLVRKLRKACGSKCRRIK